MTLLQVVVGGQAGSEGKGAIAAYLASLHTDGLSIRVAGPNAGHTVIGRCPPTCELGRPAPGGDGHALGQHPWRLRQVPVAAVSSDDMLAVAAGSEIDSEVLLAEVSALDAAGYDVSGRLVIDAQATLIEQHHKDLELHEGLAKRIGSTGKGIGAARADRIWRAARIAGDLDVGPLSRLSVVTSVSELAARHLRQGGEVLVEGTQGHLLGLHAGFYPQCTSSDCTAVDFLSMAGLSPWLVGPDEFEVWVVFRPFPIRVAGNSGPMYRETTWEDLGLPTELTTVTRKPRRVGLWDAQAARQAMYANGLTVTRPGPVRAALTMTDQAIPGLAGSTSLNDLSPEDSSRLFALLADKGHDLGCLVSLAGTGPSSVIDLRKIWES